MLTECNMPWHWFECFNKRIFVDSRAGEGVMEVLFYLTRNSSFLAGHSFKSLFLPHKSPSSSGILHCSAVCFLKSPFSLKKEQKMDWGGSFWKEDVPQNCMKHDRTNSERKLSLLEVTLTMNNLFLSIPVCWPCTEDKTSSVLWCIPIWCFSN